MNNLGPVATRKTRISQITIGASRTVNLGNYESIRIEGSCTVDIEPEDADMIAYARTMALEEVKTQMELAYKECKPK